MVDVPIEAYYVGGFLLVMYLIYRYKNRQGQRPLNIEPDRGGYSQLRLGNNYYDIIKVEKGLADGWNGHGYPIVITIDPPLINRHGSHRQGESRIVVDDRFCTGRDEDGRVIRDFEEKWTAPYSVVSVHKDVFEADLPEVGAAHDMARREAQLTEKRKHEAQARAKMRSENYVFEKTVEVDRILREIRSGRGPQDQARDLYSSLYSGYGSDLYDYGGGEGGEGEQSILNPQEKRRNVI